MRDGRLDAIRGAAVVLMMLDHLLVVVSPTHWLRFTLTRLSLPGFMLVSGWLLDRRAGRVRGRRLFAVAGAGIFASGVFVLIGAPAPDILLVLLLTVPLWPVLVKYPVVIGGLGLLQAVNVPVSWPGYQPGYVLLWLALGVLACRAGEVVPEWRAEILERIGRRPLLWYVGHLVPVLVIGVMR